MRTAVFHARLWSFLTVTLCVIRPCCCDSVVASAQISPDPAVADSVITIQFTAGIPADYPSQFAASRSELRDDYSPWYLGRGFYVFAMGIMIKKWWFSVHPE